MPRSRSTSSASASTSTRCEIGAPWYPERQATPDSRSALVTARMPSPRNSSPAPSRSFATSLLNERSAIRVPLRPPPRALLCGPQLTQLHATAIIFERTYHQQALCSERGKNHALDLHRRRGRDRGGIGGIGPGSDPARGFRLRRKDHLFARL